MKSIQGPADLAVNGAAPAFAEMIHVGRPNIGSRELMHRYLDDIIDARYPQPDGYRRPRQSQKSIVRFGADTVH